MRKDLLNKIVNELKQKLFLERKVRYTDLPRGGYADREWRKILDPIFDKYRVAVTDRKMYRETTIREITQYLKENQDFLELIEKGIKEIEVEEDSDAESYAENLSSDKATGVKTPAKEPAKKMLTETHKFPFENKGLR